MTKAKAALADRIHPFQFFDKLKWLDRKQLPATIEPYRARIFESVLWTLKYPLIFKRGRRPRRRPRFGVGALGNAR